MTSDQQPDRNLAMELVRATESAALAAARWQGRGDKNGADGAAVDAMRLMLGTVEMDGVIVIGEGEKDEAPMLFNGEKVGTGRGPAVDIAVDPLEGTSLLAMGHTNAISVVAASPRGTMYNPSDLFYMDKIAVGPEARGCIDLSAPISWNLERVAQAKGLPVEETTVVVLDRDRNTFIVDEVRAAGARIRFIDHGDVAGAVMTGLPGTGVDMLLGIGGSPEGVISACAMKCLGGDMQGRLWPRNEDERQAAIERGVDIDHVLTLEELVSGDDVLFAATGVTSGELVRGINFRPGGAESESLVMRSKSGTTRRILAEHHWRKLERISGGRYRS